MLRLSSITVIVISRTIINGLVCLVTAVRTAAGASLSIMTRFVFGPKMFLFVLAFLLEIRSASTFV